MCALRQLIVLMRVSKKYTLVVTISNKSRFLSDIFTDEVMKIYKIL